ncbi:hypothetical protein [Streptomyces decoyicus]
MALRAGGIADGQSASFVDSVRPAAEVFRAIDDEDEDEAEVILDSRPRSLLGRPTT